MTNDKPLYASFITGVIAFLSLLLLGMSSCNPVKQVLKDESKKRQVWEQGVLSGWCVNDSVFVSDTTIVLDTLHSIDYSTDTVTVDNVKYIEKVSYRTVEKKITIHDTAIVKDNKQIELQGKLIDSQRAEMSQIYKDLKESEALEKQRRKERNKWRLYFFISIGAFGAWLLRKPILKLIKPL